MHTQTPQTRTQSSVLTTLPSSSALATLSSVAALCSLRCSTVEAPFSLISLLHSATMLTTFPLPSKPEPSDTMPTNTDSHQKHPTIKQTFLMNAPHPMNNVAISKHTTLASFGSHTLLLSSSCVSSYPDYHEGPMIDWKIDDQIGISQRCPVSYHFFFFCHTLLYVWSSFWMSINFVFDFFCFFLGYPCTNISLFSANPK